MDEAVKKALCAALLLAAGTAAAQALQDPTRPPANLIAAAAGAGRGAAATAPAGPQLQTILIGRAPGGRHLAVIDGETLRPGDDFHGARVARIADNEVELVRGRERQVLRLTPKAADGMTPAPARR
jgi:MSHA biogenesis protein MshK